MENTDTLTVYWTPAAYVPQQESWTILYTRPQSLSSLIRQKRNDELDKVGMFGCPAVSDLFTNTFVFSSVIDDEHDIPFSTIIGLENAYSTDELGTIAKKQPLTTNGKVSVSLDRKSSLKNYVDIRYNLAWLFCADEPVEGKFTAPYYPPTSPGEGVCLSSGRFNIGLWYRPWTLDYHVPYTTPKLVFKENDPLFFLEVETKKKVVFKRFISNDVIYNMTSELAQTPARYKRFIPLSKRYEMATNSLAREQLLFEIKKNVVED